MAASDSDRLLVEQIRGGDQQAWRQLIDRFEGRLLAYVEARLGRRTAGEDVVQETFIGFLNSLPNYDLDRSLETYLFSIAAHKLTDHLRREGRRPALPLVDGPSGTGPDLADSVRRPSSLAQSGERRSLEESALAQAMHEQLGRVIHRGDWTKLRCLELLFVREQSNKQIAAQLGLSEQAVANYKSDFLERLRALVRQQNLPAGIVQQAAPES
jgi:RNA polymerase sigma-70 factor (ECF subfamily)